MPAEETVPQKQAPARPQSRIVERSEDPGHDDYFFVDDKEPGFVYRWCNQKDRAMMMRKREGWEVDNRPEASLPQAVAAMGQELANPAGGTVRQRGDVILMRIPRDRFETRVRAPREAARERQRITVDTMVSSANEQARKGLAARGYKGDQIRSEHVFKTTDDSKF